MPGALPSDRKPVQVLFGLDQYALPKVL